MSEFGPNPVLLPSPVGNIQRYRPNSSGAEKPLPPREAHPKDEPEAEPDEEPEHQLDVRG